MGYTRVLALLCTITVGYGSAVYGQCICAGPNPSPINEDVVIAQDQNLNAYITLTDSAVNLIETRLQASGATFHVRFVNGSGRVVYMHQDPALNDGDAWADSDYSEIRIKPDTLTKGDAFITFNIIHEIMHVLGYQHPYFEWNCPDNSSIMQPSGPKPDILTHFTALDRCAMYRDFNGSAPSQDPSYFDGTRWGNCGGDGQACDPLVLSFEHEGPRFCAPEVMFDLDGSGRSVITSWTVADREDAFVALDLNSDGQINNGTELLGNATILDRRVALSGFDALAWYDLPQNGGNGDGWITPADKVFTRLLLWFDRNHNGVSEPDELQPLWLTGVNALSTAPEAIGRRDAFGNYFRLRSRVDGVGGVAGFLYDVYLARK